MNELIIALHTIGREVGFLDGCRVGLGVLGLIEGFVVGLLDGCRVGLIVSSIEGE